MGANAKMLENICAGLLERQVRGRPVHVMWYSETLGSFESTSCMNSRMNFAGSPHLPDLRSLCRSTSDEIFTSSWV